MVRRFAVTRRRAEFDSRVRRFVVEYLCLSVGTLYPSQPKLGLAGRVEALLLNDLHCMFKNQISVH